MSLICCQRRIMSSIAMYNPINMPDADVFAAAAIVLITLATATLILQIESLKQINAVQDCMQTQAAPSEEPVAEAPVAEAPGAEAPVAEAPVAEAPVAEAPVAETKGEAEAVSPYPITRPRGMSKEDYIRLLQTYRGLGAKKMLTRPAGMTKDKFIEGLHKLIKLADQANKWRQNNPDKMAAQREREKQKRAARRRLTFR